MSHLNRSLLAPAFILSLLTVGGLASPGVAADGIPPDPSDFTWTAYDPPVTHVLGTGFRAIYATLFGESNGTFAFATLPMSYGCTISGTIESGTTHELSAAFEGAAGPLTASVGLSVSISVNAAYAHTSPPCKTCMLWTKYTGAKLYRYLVAHQSWVGGPAFAQRAGWHNVLVGGTRSIVPTCADTFDACALLGQTCPPPPNDSPAGGDGEEVDLGVDGSVLVIRLDELVLDPSGFPEGHPAYTPVGFLADLTPWHRCQLASDIEVAEALLETTRGESVPPIRYVAIVEESGDPTIFDLELTPQPFQCDCVADVNDDGVVNGVDLGGMLSVWGSDDLWFDMTDDGVVDAEDLGVLLAGWGSCAG